jgi:acetoin utilization protein AcuC
MSKATAFIYSESYQDYNFSPWHPMKPIRLKLTAELIDAYGMEHFPGASMVEPRIATVEELRLVHDDEYIDKVQELSLPGAQETFAAGWGLGTADNPIFFGMHQASAAIAGASLLAAEKIMSGEIDHGFNVAGGLHHAQKARASGFCIYNDMALAIKWLREKHNLRVAYIDVDAHHGDGVQNAFYSDPDVLTISFHESGHSLFPGTGYPADIGEGDAAGTAVNLPLAPYTTDDLFLAAFDQLVPPLVRAFRPDVLVTQNGCDAHWEDPLSHLSITLDGFAAIWKRLHGLAHEHTAGRLLAAGGGGYQAFSVVPRAWTLLMAELTHAELPDDLPPAWRQLCERQSGEAAPNSLRLEHPPAVDAQAYELARDAADKGVAEIKRRVFPLAGIKTGD